MKKLLTILGMSAAMAMPALAFTPGKCPVVSQEKIATPEMIQSIKTLSASISSGLKTNELPAGVVRHKYQTSDAIYDIAVASTGYKITDYWKFTNAEGDVMTFEDLPFYVVEYYIEKSDFQGNRLMVADNLVSWPTYCIWDVYSPTQTENYDIVPLAEIGSRQDERLCCTWAYTSDDNILWTWEGDSNSGYISSYGIWTNDAGATVILNGQKGSLYPCGDVTKTSQFKIDSFDIDEKYLESSNQFYLVVGDNKPYSAEGNITVNYAGTCRQFGFYLYHHNYDFSEIRIFDAGVKDPINGVLSPSEDAYDFDWTAKQKFYFCAADKFLDFGVDPSSTNFNPEKISMGWREGVADTDKVEENINFLQGYIYAPAPDDKTKIYEYPYGNYELETLEILKENPYNPKLEEIIYVVPEDYSIIPWNVGDYMWAEYDGFNTAWEGAYWVWRATKKVGGNIAIGTENGVEFWGRDVYGNTYTGKFDGDIIYHNDRKNMQTFKTIPAKNNVINGVDEVAKEDARYTVNALNGNITVKSTDNNNVMIFALDGAQVANATVLAGEEVSFNVAKGVYIVKVGKSTTKVVL